MNMVRQLIADSRAATAKRDGYEDEYLSSLTSWGSFDGFSKDEGEEAAKYARARLTAEELELIDLGY